MRYIVEVQGERIPVEIVGETILVDGQPVSASLSASDGSAERLLRVGAAVHRVQLRRGDGAGRWEVELHGHRLGVEALDERTRTVQELTRGASAARGPAPLVAPMPGLVVRVLAAPGDQVAAGAPLLVMEAMKMENELRAPAAGVVRAVHAAPGQAVEKGAVLVELAAEVP